MKMMWKNVNCLFSPHRMIEPAVKVFTKILKQMGPSKVGLVMVH